MNMAHHFLRVVRKLRLPLKNIAIHFERHEVHEFTRTWIYCAYIKGAENI